MSKGNKYPSTGPTLRLKIFFFFHENQIQCLFHPLVVNMGKYLPKKGKVLENNECRKARLIFQEPFPFDANISHINHKRIKYIVYFL